MKKFFGEKEMHSQEMKREREILVEENSWKSRIEVVGLEPRIHMG